MPNLCSAGCGIQNASLILCFHIICVLDDTAHWIIFFQNDGRSPKNSTNCIVNCYRFSKNRVPLNIYSCRRGRGQGCVVNKIREIIKQFLLSQDNLLLNFHLNLHSSANNTSSQIVISYSLLCTHFTIQVYNLHAPKYQLIQNFRPTNHNIA